MIGPHILGHNICIQAYQGLPMMNQMGNQQANETPCNFIDECIPRIGHFPVVGTSNSMRNNTY